MLAQHQVDEKITQLRLLASNWEPKTIEIKPTPEQFARGSAIIDTVLETLPKPCSSIEGLVAAICLELRIDIEEQPLAQKNMLYSQARQLQAVGVTTDEFFIKAKRYRIKFPTITFTINGLINNWANLGSIKRTSVPPPIRKCLIDCLCKFMSLDEAMFVMSKKGL